MIWLPIVLLGHLANAGAFVIDKILLTKRLPHPAVYAFYIGVLNIFVVLFLPLADFSVPPFYVLVSAAIAGTTFIAALLSFFTALKIGDASRVVPVVGSTIPIFTIPFAAIFLGEVLIGAQYYGILLLIVGAALISYENQKNKNPITRSEVGHALLAALLFAISFTFTKAVFRDTEFFNGLIWMRFFSFLTALPLLVIPAVGRAILSKQRHQERPSFLFFAGQLIGAAGFLLLSVALKLAPQVTIVNALQGVQYAFLFVLVYFLRRFSPRLLAERFTHQEIFRKTVALIFLGVGLAVVAAV